MNIFQKTFAAFGVLMTLVAASPALAQETEVDEIIVEARLSGAPTWEVTRGGSTLLLVGAIQALPKDLGWRPDALERVAARADRVLFSQSVDVSPWDVMRMIWRSRTLTRLPDRTTSADYLAPEWQARLDAVEARHDEDFSTTSFFLTASGLMFNVTGLRRDRGLAADEVVRRTARRGRTPSERVGRVRGDEVIDDLLEMPPERWTPCIQKANSAAEAGEAGMLGRAQAWRRFDVPGVMNSALEDALSVIASALAALTGLARSNLDFQILSPGCVSRGDFDHPSPPGRTAGLASGRLSFGELDSILTPSTIPAPS
jgi:hypothetical protein